MKLRLLPGLLACLMLAACAGPEVAVPSAPMPSPEPIPSFTPGPVFTDWSKLEPYESPENRYTRYYAEYTDRLLPVEGGYGSELLPFAGSVLDTGLGWNEYRYGLAAQDGTVVCDPVYDTVLVPSYYDYELGDSVELGDFLLMTWTETTGGDGAVEFRNGATRFTVAASDGRWVLDADIQSYRPLSDDRLLLLDQSEKLWICDGDGRLETSPLEMKLSELWGDSWGYLGGFEDGIGCLPVYDSETGACTGSWLADARTGYVKFLTEVDACYAWSGEQGYAVAHDYTQDRLGYLSRSGEWIIPPQFLWANSFRGDYAIVGRSGGTAAIIDRAGAVVLESQGGTWTILQMSDGKVAYWDSSDLGGRWLVHGVYDEDLQPVDHPAVGRYLDALYDVPAEREGDLWTIYDGGTVWQVTVDARLYGCRDGIATFMDEMGSQGIYDCKTGTWIIPLGTYSYLNYRETDGAEVYFGSRLTDSGGNALDVLRADGTLLARGQESVELYGGLICVVDSLGCAWLDQNGEAVFRWRFPLGND